MTKSYKIRLDYVDDLFWRNGGRSSCYWLIVNVDDQANYFVDMAE